VFVALPIVRADNVVGRLNQLDPTVRLKEVPEGRKVKDPEVAMIGFAVPPQSTSKKERRMFAVLAVTGVPALKPIVGLFWM
jgi:hypothetical protein